MKNISLLVLPISLLFFSCKKNTDSPKGAAEVDIYVAGSDNGTHQCWKNDVKLFDHSAIRYNSLASGVAIKNGDVYLSGLMDNDKAIYWKNGQMTILNSPITSICRSRAIYFSGNDMYVTGMMIGESSNASPGYWKNGVFYALGSYGIVDTECRDMKIVNNTSHAVGYVNDMAVYWNGTDSTVLAQYGSVAHKIVVSGNDVHIVGRGQGTAAYWKNGTMTELTQVFGDARGLAVVGDDVYIAGNDIDTAVYWKNGQKIKLEEGVATDIQVVDGDVYVTGYARVNQIETVVYWKNGTRHVVEAATNQYYSGKGYAMAVVKK